MYIYINIRDVIKFSRIMYRERGCVFEVHSSNAEHPGNVKPMSSAHKVNKFSSDDLRSDKEGKRANSPRIRACLFNNSPSIEKERLYVKRGCNARHLRCSHTKRKTRRALALELVFIGEKSRCNVHLSGVCAQHTNLDVWYLAEGNRPEGDPQKNPGAVQEPAPFVVVRVDGSSGGCSYEVTDGHKHPAGLYVLVIRWGGDPASFNDEGGQAKWFMRWLVKLQGCPVGMCVLCPEYTFDH